MKTEDLIPGMVVKAIPETHPRFPQRKQRTCVVLRDGSMMPMTHSQCRRRHLKPSKENGLWKDVDLMTEVRFILTDSSSYTVIGQLSDAEMSVVEMIARRNQPSLFLEVK